MTSAMKQWLSTAGTALLIGSTGIGATSQAPPQSTAPAGQSQDSRQATTPVKPDEIIVTGCLSAENADGEFMLNEATLTAEAKAAGHMQPNRSAPETEQVRKTPRTYRLSGADLNAHVGQRVEVTGSVDESTSARSGRDTVGTSGSAGATATDRTTDGTPRADDRATKLNVRSFKTVSGTCT